MIFSPDKPKDSAILSSAKLEQSTLRWIILADGINNCLCNKGCLHLAQILRRQTLYCIDTTCVYIVAVRNLHEI